MLQPAKFMLSWTSSIRITSFISRHYFVVTLYCTVSFHCLAGQRLNRSRKFKVENSFARAESCLYSYVFENFLARFILQKEFHAREINRVLKRE